ncbi:MAG: ABC transporter substrate-binding protein [Gammaproteobacteria bacterium]|nr:ABC transporter substrate-binding protein [Gammaproteobacteria bacterium]
MNISNFSLSNSKTSFFIFLWLIISPSVNANLSDNTIRIAVSKSPLSAPFIIAQHNGYFNEAGLNVAFDYYNGGHRAIKALFSGDAEIATSSEAVVMFNSFKRQDFSLFCTFVTSDNDVKILTHTDSGILNLQQLKGKKVGTILGSSAHFFLSQTLLMNGINSKDVHISSVNPENSYKMLNKQNLDAIVTWEPHAYLGKKELGNKARFIEHDRVYIETFNAISMRDYAENNADKLASVTRSLIKATDFIKKHPLISQNIIAKNLNKEAHIITATWKDYSFSISLDQWLLTSLEAEARWAIEQNFTTAKDVPDYTEFINIAPLKKASPQNVFIFQ